MAQICSTAEGNYTLILFSNLDEETYEHFIYSNAIKFFSYIMLGVYRYMCIIIF